MQKLLAGLAAALLAASSQAQTTANTPPIGQAVSGNNATASGTSGTGLRTNGAAQTGSSHGAAGRTAAGVDSSGKVVAPSTAVLGATPENRDNVNAQATNTTPPAGTAADAPATGGRGETGSKAEHEIGKANARAVHEVPGARMKTPAAAEKAKEAQAKERHKAKQGESANDKGS